jgi:hypothetical protein
VCLPNVLCCERNYDNCHDDQCSHLHPEIVGQSGFVAGLCVHLVTSLSYHCSQGVAELVRPRLSRDASLHIDHWSAASEVLLRFE